MIREKTEGDRRIEWGDRREKGRVGKIQISFYFTHLLFLYSPFFVCFYFDRVSWSLILFILASIFYIFIDSFNFYYDRWKKEPSWYGEGIAENGERAGLSNIVHLQGEQNFFLFFDNIFLVYGNYWEEREKIMESYKGLEINMNMNLYIDT